MATPAFARPVEGTTAELGVPPQETPTVIPYLSHGLTAADVAPPVVPDAFERAVQASLQAPADTGRSYAIEPGRSWYLATDSAPARPDDRGDRFVVGDGTPAAPVTDGDGFAVDWENGLIVGGGTLAIVFALALALAYTRRPRIAV